MAKNSGFHLKKIISYCGILFMITAYASVVDHNKLNTWMAMKAAAPTSCHGSIAECSGSGEEEFNMDSEINRRILATSNYISYGALQRNTVPCSRRGASYYNCKPGAEVNPYTRGCSAITRCRS